MYEDYTHCARCGTEIPPRTQRGQPRKYCSDNCRKRAGDARRKFVRQDNCPDCGDLKDVKAKRCRKCCKTRVGQVVEPASPRERNPDQLIRRSASGVSDSQLRFRDRIDRISQMGRQTW